MILVHVLNICFFKCLYLNKAVKLSLSVYWIFTTDCLKVIIFSCFRHYLLNEMMIRQTKFTFLTGTILVMRDAILRFNCGLYNICRLFPYYSNFIFLKATLVVNVASYCQHTDKNYIALQELHREFGPSHFTVLAFPCNQFGESEPSSSQEIESFAKGNYGVTFPVFHKIKILGSEADPAFKFLIGNCFLLRFKLPVTMVLSLNPGWVFLPGNIEVFIN